jgi:hypothetical protein
MKPADNIKRLIKNTKIKTNPAVNEAVLNDLLNKLDSSENISSAAKQPSVWRIIMKRPIIKFAVAACVLAAIGLLLYRYSSNLDGATNAYATVLENIRKAHSVAYKERIISDKSDNTSSVMINIAGIKRDDMGNGSILISDPHNDIQLTLSAINKKAFIHKHIGREKKDFNWLTWITERFSRQGEYQGRRMFQEQVADLYVTNEPFRKCYISIADIFRRTPDER